MDRSFVTTITVDQTPEEVFAAINDVGGWWSEEIEGHTDELGAFTYHYRDIHRCTIEVAELVPGRKVVWHVLDNYFSFTKDPAEWTGTKMIFDIVPRDGDRTTMRFTHQGLVPEDECYEACNQGWTTYITKSLRDLIATGKGQPNAQEPLTETERRLSA